MADSTNNDVDGQTGPENDSTENFAGSPSARLAARKTSRGAKSGRNLKSGKNQRHIREKRRSTGVIQLEEKPANETETKSDREAKQNAEMNESLGQVYPESPQQDGKKVLKEENVSNESSKETEDKDRPPNVSSLKEGDKDSSYNKINSQEEEVVATKVLTTPIATYQRSNHREHARQQGKTVPNGNKDSTDSGLPVRGHSLFKLENYKSEFSYSVSSPISLDKISAMPVTMTENSTTIGNRLSLKHNNSETTICEKCKKAFDRERWEKQRLQKKLAEAEELTTKLRKELNMLNEDLISAEEEVDKLKEENSALVSVVGRLSTN